MGTNTRILIVDDESRFSSALQSALEARGFEVTTARNRLQGQEVARAAKPDVVILGTMMPQGDAFLLHQWLRRDSRFREVPIMVVDAAPEERFVKGWRREEGMMMEAEDYLCKPIEPSALMARIDRLVKRARQRISVLVVDDHPIVRDGIRAFLGLQDGIQVVGEAVDGMDALEKTRLLSPDIVLMDIVMPGMDGLQATRLIRGSHPDTRVLMLTQYDDEENAVASAEVGAHGLIPKKNASAQLLAGIRSAYEGGRTDYATGG